MPEYDHAPSLDSREDVPVREDLGADKDSELTTPDVELSEDMDGYDVWRYLWFIKLPEDIETKAPEGYSWGGYSTDFERNADVYTVEQVAASEHSRWGVPGFNAPEESPTDPNLIVIDLDVYKDEAPDLSEIEFSYDLLMAEVEPVVVESQRGGVHIYALVNEPPVKEPDFDMPEWIDLRGEAVKQHVVAPTEVPGNEAEGYTIRNEVAIPEFDSYHEFCEMLTMDDGDTQLIEYPESLSSPSSSPNYSTEDPPEGIPQCYERALSARADGSFRSQHGNPWKVDTLCGQLGIALGYDLGTIADHFEEFPKGGDSSEYDRNLTVSHLKRLAGKMRDDDPELHAPTALTLRGHGILNPGESCACNLHKCHDPDVSRCSEYYAYLTGSHERDADLLRECLQLREEYEELQSVKPPYGALREIARRAELPMEDDGTLGEYSWSIARSGFEDMDPDEV
jgi:hypothetical protein